jgi:hypothetical protein
VSPTDITTHDLDDGKLFALMCPYELDGRVSSHPVSVRGWTTMNCYLLVEDDRALLYNTGFSVHQDALLGQLDELISDRPLSLAIPRVEFASMCNARPIADRFNVDVVHQRIRKHPSTFLNFRPELTCDELDGLRDVELSILTTGTPLSVDRAGRRKLELLMPELRLLPCNWGYDPETRTLFTGDLFSWIWQDTPAGPWLLEDERDDPTTPERLHEFLVRNRYWWLAGADTAPLRRALAELFERYEIAVIAPDHGPVLRGDAVTRHRDLLDELLDSVASERSVGVDAGRWSMASGR